MKYLQEEPSRRNGTGRGLLPRLLHSLSLPGYAVQRPCLLLHLELITILEQVFLDITQLLGTHDEGIAGDEVSQEVDHHQYLKTTISTLTSVWGHNKDFIVRP